MACQGTARSLGGALVWMSCSSKRLSIASEPFLLSVVRSMTPAKDLKVLKLLADLCLKEYFQKQSPCFY